MLALKIVNQASTDPSVQTSKSSKPPVFVFKSSKFLVFNMGLIWIQAWRKWVAEQDVDISLIYRESKTTNWQIFWDQTINEKHTSCVCVICAEDTSKSQLEWQQQISSTRSLLELKRYEKLSPRHIQTRHKKKISTSYNLWIDAERDRKQSGISHSDLGSEASDQNINKGSSTPVGGAGSQ
ncbi:hypothetical protein DFH08DRAFT_1021044 [Mycena albidolilacea]|uniref:Uncharacterized protein n=1 Tax=Mycena albidolilacea TaxID=1033008 RepID=A0AAD6ZPR3_9AGAR|nr:hypothetical protein DFH08DRAFT_1021044 [Mycena albidolilacea]